MGWETWKNAVKWILLSPCIVCVCGTLCVTNLCQCRKPFATRGIYCGTSQLNNETRARQRAREEAHKRNAPRPLPEPRKRALTAPLPLPEGYHHDGDNAKQGHKCGLKCQMRVYGMQRTFDQTQSPLFSRLPAEVRRLIYIDVFGGENSVVHVVRKYQRLGHLRCTSTCRSRELPYSGESCWGSKDETGDWYPTPEKARTDDGSVHLLRTCRKIYSEAIDILYQHTTFAFRNFKNQDTLWHFSRTILPQRLNSIRKMHLTWFLDYKHFLGCNPLTHWTQTCDILARMTGLQNLQISLDTVGLVLEDIDAERERNVLMPLKTITKTNIFSVRLWWHPFEPEELLKDAPFQLSWSD